MLINSVSGDRTQLWAAQPIDCFKHVTALQQESEGIRKKAVYHFRGRYNLSALNPEIILPKASLSSFSDLSSSLVNVKRVDPCQKPWITHHERGHGNSKGLMVCVWGLQGFTLKHLHFNSSVAWEEPRRRVENWDSSELCRMHKSVSVCREFVSFSICVCVCGCTWRSLSFTVSNNPPGIDC